MAFDDELPRDVWVDVETGEWGLRSNLRLIRQTELPRDVGNKKLPKRAIRALVRCAGLDRGLRLPAAGIQLPNGGRDG